MALEVSLTATSVLFVPPDDAFSLFEEDLKQYA